MLRILIIDNNRTFRHSLRNLFLDRFSDMEVETLGGPPGTRDLLSETARFDPDIVFADMHTFSDDAAGFARMLKRRWPDRALVLMCSSDIREYRQSAYGAGADCCLLKDESTFDGFAVLVGHLRRRIAKRPGPGSDPGTDRGK